MDLKFLSEHQINNMLDMKTCIGLMKNVFTAFAEEKIENKLRSVFPVEAGKVFGVMPAVIPTEDVCGAKLITAFHTNHAKGLPSHLGIVAVFSNDDGQLLGICDGTAITAIRTGAVSALATDYMAKKDSHTMCLIGGGVQAVMHLKAITLVRDIKKVTVWCPTLAESEKFCETHKDEYPEIEFIPCEKCEDAVRDADIINTLTPSPVPVLFGKWVKPGAHINAVGACSKTTRELDSECVAKARLFCDNYDSCRNEAGDYLFPLNEGIIGESHIQGDLARVISGKVTARTDNKDITMFESQGLACEDVACAAWLLKQ
ncbi:MAG: ornithine cyclodeaminase family protein [Oscillospiraceae bacterium]|nr:ornithine cyclodeaminase family protein [Oscillospiraceae bacterium]